MREIRDEYDLDRLRELAQADQEGRCVVLPRWMKKNRQKFTRGNGGEREWLSILREKR